MPRRQRSSTSSRPRPAYREHQHLHPQGKQYVPVLSGLGGWAGIGMAAGLTEFNGGLGAVGRYRVPEDYTQLGGQLTVFEPRTDPGLASPCHSSAGSRMRAAAASFSLLPLRWPKPNRSRDPQWLHSNHTHHSRRQSCLVGRFGTGRRYCTGPIQNLSFHPETPITSRTARWISGLTMAFVATTPNATSVTALPDLGAPTPPLC